jgi:hypothetical protein
MGISNCRLTREQHLERFTETLVNFPPFSPAVWCIHGDAGVGKSLLIERMREICLWENPSGEGPWGVVHADGQVSTGDTADELHHVWEQIDHLIRAERLPPPRQTYADTKNVLESLTVGLRHYLDHKPLVLVLDTYERLRALDLVMAEHIFPLTETGRLLCIVGGAFETPPLWLDRKRSMIHTIHLGDFSPEEASSYLQKRAVPGEWIPTVSSFAYYNPLLLTFTADLMMDFALDPVTPLNRSQVLDHLLETWFESSQGKLHRRILEAASVVSSFSTELLQALLEEEDVDKEQIERLIRLGFVRRSTNKEYVVHQNIRGKVLSELRSQPLVHGRLQLRALQFYAERKQALLNGNRPERWYRLSLKQLFLVDDPSVRAAFFPRESPEHLFFTRRARPEDRAGVERIRKDYLEGVFLAGESPSSARDLLATSVTKWFQQSCRPFRVAVRAEDNRLLGFSAVLAVKPDMYKVLMSDPKRMHYWVWVDDSFLLVDEGYHEFDDPETSSVRQDYLIFGIVYESKEVEFVRAILLRDLFLGFAKAPGRVRRVLVVTPIPEYQVLLPLLGFDLQAEAEPAEWDHKMQFYMLDLSRGSLDVWLERLVCRANPVAGPILRVPVEQLVGWLEQDFSNLDNLLILSESPLAKSLRCLKTDVPEDPTALGERYRSSLLGFLEKMHPGEDISPTTLRPNQRSYYAIVWFYRQGATLDTIARRFGLAPDNRAIINIRREGLRCIAQALQEQELTFLRSL